MKRFLPYLILIIILLTTESLYMSSFARCSIDTLKNVCDVCEERALSKLNTDSICPACPEVNCPQPSQACIKLNSFENFLSSNYTLNAMIWSGQPDEIYKLSISKSTDFNGAFNYDVRYKNFRTAAAGNTGFLLYDIVNFNLPLQLGDKLYSYNCIGGIDNTSSLKGVCSTIAQDDFGTVNVYSFPFTALPSSSPLQ